MPANLAHVLNLYLDIWRVNWDWIRNSLIKNHYLANFPQDELDPYLRRSGYENPMSGQNLTVILFFVCVICTIWLLLIVKDVYGPNVIVKRRGFIAPVRGFLTWYFN